MSEIAISRELMPTKGRYVARIEGVEAEAELTFSRTSPTLVIADHTFGPDSMRGKGGRQGVGRPADRGRTIGRIQDHPAVSLREGAVPPPPRMGGRDAEVIWFSDPFMESMT